jgi:SHS2 domain-containing protein
MISSEDSYKIGEEVFYSECGEVDRVRVLENKSDVDFIKYKLEVLEVLRESEIIKPDEIGDVFECRKKREYEKNIELWHLVEKWNDEDWGISRLEVIK